MVRIKSCVRLHTYCLIVLYVLFLSMGAKLTRIRGDVVLFTRGGHSNRLCTNTRDRGQELGQAVKAENLEGQAVKGTTQIRKSQTVHSQKCHPVSVPETGSIQFYYSSIGPAMLNDSGVSGFSII